MLLSPIATWAQAGKNGALTITAANTILNEYATLAADVSVSSTSITLPATGTTPTLLNANKRFSGSLQAGDLLLIYQGQGASMSTTEGSSYGSVSALGSAGRYQLVQVAAVPATVASGANTVTLTCALYAAFTTAGHAQVVRVPRYSSLTITPSAAGTAATPTITAQAWDGSTGGILVAEVQGNITLNNGATLDVSGKGFRGGVVKQTTDAANNQNYAFASASSTYGAAKGESIVGYTTEYNALTGTYGRGAPANGGGGGNSHNGGGGGGANAAASGMAYTGTGNPVAGYDASWNLESANFATSTSSGGGRGGYSYATANQSPATYGPNLDSWGGDRRRVKGGLGGRPVNAQGRAFFGGGGGAGDSNDGTGTSGATGGGFLYLVSGGTVSGSGNLLANGSSPAGYIAGTTGSHNDGAGGGGGGGSIVVQASATNDLALNALGGQGGSQIYANTTTNESEGGGGGGSGGYIAYLPGAAGTATASVSGGANGTSNAVPVVTAFPPNGATIGGSGLLEATSASCTTSSLAALNSLNNTNCTAVADVSTTISFSSNPQAVNKPVTITAGFRNAGPNEAANVTRTVQLPANLTGTVTVTTNQGTGTYAAATGQVTFTSITLASGSTAADATITYTPAQTGSVVVASTISTSTTEACQTDNDASGNATLVVEPVADLKVALTANTTGVVINSAATNSITYTTLITNQTTSADASGANATGVTLTMQLPKALLNPTLPSGASYSAATGVLTLSVGTITLNSSVSYNFTFTLSPNNQRTATNGAQVVATASATANELDTNPNDNTNQQLTIPVSMPTGSCSGLGYDGNPATQGLVGEYYKGYFADDLTYFDASKHTASITRTDGWANYAASNGWGDVTSASNGGDATNPDYFSARLRGSLTITTSGSYTFRTSSDDASYVWVGDAAREATLDATKTVVKAAGAHGTGNIDGTAVTLAAGTYPVLILYGDNTGTNALTVSYSGPDTGSAMKVIPQSALCTLGYTPLPVVLTSFTAVAEGPQAAHLRWTTASELHSDHVEVERSRDGVAFERIGRVVAAGTTLATHAYSFVDALAATPAGGAVYYRLRQVDLDGSATYSPVQTVDFAASGNTMLVFYPNPTRTATTLDLHALATGAAGQLTICDVLGRP
ncbi:MAG: PA14 domain-containing protein, partial [Janthinobacterium lividum]